MNKENNTKETIDIISNPMPIFLCYSRCSTCRKAKKFLDESGINYFERDLVSEPLNIEEIKALLGRYNGEPRKFFNTSGIVCRQLGLKDLVPNMTEDDMATWLASDGKLVKRPIFVLPQTVLLGFNVTEWNKIINQ